MDLFDSFLTKPEESPEKTVAALIRTILLSQDTRVGFSINIKAVRALVQRLVELGYNGPETYNAYIDGLKNGQILKYSATNALNSFRFHCEKRLQRAGDVPDDTVLTFHREEIIVAYNSRTESKGPSEVPLVVDDKTADN